MKYLFASVFALACLLTTGEAFAQPGVPMTVGAPMLTPDKTTHDYGTIKKGSDGNCTFVITNTGDQPLILSRCQGSCGCTTPKCDTNPVMPGESTEIKVHYDTMRLGQFTKTVSVYWNNPEGTPYTLTIKGQVIE